MPHKGLLVRDLVLVSGHYWPMPPQETQTLKGRSGTVSCGGRFSFPWVLVHPRFCLSLGSSSLSLFFFFFLITNDTVALNCILNSCRRLYVLFYVIGSCASKTNSASSDKDNPLAISYIVNLLRSSVTSSSSCLSLSFLWASIFIRFSMHIHSFESLLFEGQFVRNLV